MAQEDISTQAHTTQIVRPRNPQQINHKLCFATTQTTTMASPLSLPTLRGSNFLAPKPSLGSPSRPPRSLHLRTYAKFNLSELLGGRGLCNGEKGVERELTRQPEQPPERVPTRARPEPSGVDGVNDEAFDKELFGLTGGFPGGETGLERFLAKNPPPPKAAASSPGVSAVGLIKKAKAPELPLLLPGMIVIVKNEKNPFHMYCGIVQRITDGKAGVLFEGGNWDRLITFRLEELERREKGPPMVNPKSAILEGLVEQ